MPVHFLKGSSDYFIMNGRKVIALHYKAIIFDVSDTLIEYSPNYAQIFGDRLRNIGFSISEQKSVEIARAINMTICEQSKREQEGEPHISDEQLKILLDTSALTCVLEDNAEINSYIRLLENIELPKQEMKVIPGVFEVLDTLKGRYRLAIVSNHYVWLMDRLKSMGLAQYFETIIISDIVGVAKPNIKIMELALQELELEAKQCLYVGDQPFDVLCAKQVGMDCAWIASDEVSLPASIKYKEDVKIHNIGELRNVL